MQKYPLGNMKNVSGSSGHSRAKCSETTKWFQHKLGPFIQIEEQKKNNYESKQKKKSQWEEKKRLKKIMEVGRMAAYERRCQLWNPEKEQFEEEGEKEQEENGKEEEEGGGGERNEREKEAAEEKLDDSAEEEEKDDDNEELEKEGAMTEEEEEEEISEEEQEEEEEWEEMMKKEGDFKSGDEGIELVQRKVPAKGKRQREKPTDDAAIKRKRVDLFDDEASLSGDDVGSDSDGETQDDEPDEYEAEEGDLDQLPDTEEIRENLMCQYQKHQNDDSERKIRRLKKAFLPDSELHGQVGTEQGDGGDRSFRFRRHANANVDWAKLLGTTNDENEEEDKDDPAEEAWRKKRFEMNKWRAEQEEQKRRAKKRSRGEGTSGGRWDTDDEEEMWADLDSPLFALGRKNLRASKDANSDSPVPSSSHLSSSSLFADVTIPPPQKRRDSLLYSSLRRKDAATERTVPSPFVKDVRLPKHRHNV